MQMIMLIPSVGNSATPHQKLVREASPKIPIVIFLISFIYLNSKGLANSCKVVLLQPLF